MLEVILFQCPEYLYMAKIFIFNSAPSYAISFHPEKHLLSFINRYCYAQVVDISSILLKYPSSTALIDFPRLPVCLKFVIPTLN
jgi:hypothetical protein